MGKMKLEAQWRDRLREWMESLVRDFYLPLGEIVLDGFFTFEQLTPEEALAHDFETMPEGTVWGEEWQYAWMKSKIILPKEANGRRIVMELNPGGEATLFLNGQTFGTRRADWVHIPHHYLVDNILTDCAKEGESFNLLLEAYAGHYYPMGPVGEIGPVLPGMYEAPPKGEKRVAVGKSTFGIWNEAAYQLYLDVTALTQIMEHLPDTSLRAAKIARGLKDFTLAVDFEQPFEEREKDYLRGREILKPLMEAQNGTSTPVFYGVGHSHLDIVWLWPMQETVHKVARMFAQQLRMQERYPEYKFLQDQAYLYQLCKEHYPELYERVKEAINRGSWIVEGAMWVEPDGNMASGEGLIRQILYGQKFYKEEFDVDCQMLWLPDTFGYSAAMPQIFKGFGLKYLMAQKIFETYNDCDRFPYHYYIWEGMDGSQITTYSPTNYSFKMTPEQNIEAWENRAQKDELDTFLVPFGYGDGGGGATRDHLELALRQRDLEGAPRVKLASPVQMFEDLERAGGPVHKYVGELYLTMYLGMYTVQAQIKDKNRRSEFALRDAELLESLASWVKGTVYPAAALEQEWKNLLQNHFHDILCGTSIERVNEEALALYGKLLETTGAMIRESASALADAGKDNNRISIFNTFSWERSLVTELPEMFSGGAVTLDGKQIPVTQIDGKVYGYVTLPSCGCEVLLPGNSEEAELPSVKITEIQAGWQLENSKIKAVINTNGEVISYISKESGREFAKEPMNRFHLYKDVPRLFDAWDIDAPYEEQEIELNHKAQIRILESGGLRGILRVEKTIGNSSLSQDIILDAQSEVLIFRTKMQWNELHRLLKVNFPVNVYANEAINEIQFGYIKRPTHRSRQYDKDLLEVCGHRYTALADESHGAAVLNNNKYGVNMRDNSINLTLLRAAASPVMRSDNGEQNFTYAFTGWNGTFKDSRVVQQGYELNNGVILTEGGEKAESYLATDSQNIIIDTVKQAEDGSGDLILRVYESRKADTTVLLTTPLRCSAAWTCDLKEEVQQEIEIEKIKREDGEEISRFRLHFRPFEIQTIRIRR